MKRERWHKEGERGGCTIRRARDIFEHFRCYPLEQPADAYRYVDQAYKKGTIITKPIK